MEFYANEGKNIEVEVAGDIYLRHAIQTHFVTPGESYIEIMRKYVLPVYREGDFISISEKIIALCQNRIVKREDLKCGLWAKVLSKCATRTSAGVGISEVHKMQYAINKAGLAKVLYAAAASAVTKLFGRKGVFFEIVGQEILGFSDELEDKENYLKDFIKDNPAGQGQQRTPIILIRKI